MKTIIFEVTAKIEFHAGVYCQTWFSSESYDECYDKIKSYIDINKAEGETGVVTHILHTAYHTHETEY